MSREICNELAKLLLAASTIMLSGCQTVQSYLPNDNNRPSPISMKHEANKDLEASAIAGDPLAQNAYGLLYATGENVAQDYKIARKWFLASAKQGNLSAQANLALMFEDGLGVPKNRPLASALFARAARSPNPELAKKAQENWQRMFPQLSAEQRAAALTLGIELEENGAIEKFVPLEESEGTAPAKPPQMRIYEQERNNRFYRWKLSDLINAAQNGDVIAQGALGERYIANNNPHINIEWLPPYSPEEGLRWLRLAASKGDPSAMLALASTFERGKENAVNKQEALRLTLAAAQSGYSSDAQLWAGVRLEKTSNQESRKWFSLAAQNGNSLAALLVGGWHYLGDGVEKNYKEAIKWLRIGISGSISSKEDEEYLIGNMYYRGGYGVRQNYPEALRWFRLASNHGNHAARVSLGEMYANGYGIDSNNVLAYVFLSCAAQWFGPDQRAEAGLTLETDKSNIDLLDIARKNLKIIKNKMPPPEIEISEMMPSDHAQCKELEIPEYSW